MRRNSIKYERAQYSPDWSRESQATIYLGQQLAINAKFGIHREATGKYMLFLYNTFLYNTAEPPTSSKCTYIRFLSVGSELGEPNVKIGFKCYETSVSLITIALLRYQQ